MLSWHRKSFTTVGVRLVGRTCRVSHRRTACYLALTASTVLLMASTRCVRSFTNRSIAARM